MKTRPFTARARWWLREPLLHFLLAGLALFVAFRTLHSESVGFAPSNQIRLTDGDVRQLATAWVAQGRSPPTREQMENLVDMKVREEILFREAQALGLDRDDAIVKRRLAQKMDFLTEDLSGVGEASRDELEAWFKNNTDRFTSSPRASFHHLYFSPDRHGAHARDAAARALAVLRGEPPDSPATARLADRFMFQDYYGDQSLDQVASVFGSAFAQSLFGLAPGSWQGPIESGYGWHLVWTDATSSKRVPEFEEVEPEVKREWVAERRAEAKRKVYESIRARYEVIVPEMLAAQTTGHGTRP